MITAKGKLTQPFRQQHQFVAQAGSRHYLLLDDAAGGTGPMPIELVAAGLGGCAAFDVVTIVRQKYHQKVTGYEARVEADQVERPPRVFTTVRIHHAVTAFKLDLAGKSIARWGQWYRRPRVFIQPTKWLKTRLSA